MNRSHQVQTAFRAAFPYTVPILAGFLFLGIAYGIYMNSLGFSAVYPILMSLTIFAGSMEFVAANLLLGGFNSMNALFLTVMVNARHLFYGISMLEKFKGIGKRKFYLIFGMCDESFSINCTAEIPQNVDKGWFMFFVTLLNHAYWVLGATIGALFSSFVKFNTEGIDFVLTALFVVIFMEQWRKEKKHQSALIGLGVSAVALLVFGGNNFMIPAMVMILGMLTVFRKNVEKVEMSV